MPIQRSQLECIKEERKASAAEISKWRRALQRNIKNGSRQTIMWSIEEAHELGLPPNHQDVIMAESVLASLPNGEGWHPSRTEITGKEPVGDHSRGASSEGALAKAMLFGSAKDFEKAMGQFVKLTDFDSTYVSCKASTQADL